MIEIIPNWHPIFVHFTLGLLLTSVALFIFGTLVRERPVGAQATMVARWNLWIGSAFAVVTVAAGFIAYNSMPHDAEAHAAMTIHMRWALGTLILFVIAAVLAWRTRTRPAGTGPLLALFLLVGAGALLITGWLGAENVYRHGLGVMRLPQVEGTGHSHSHSEGGHTPAYTEIQTMDHDH
jgi:uncharacterized membrane protein